MCKFRAYMLKNTKENMFEKNIYQKYLIQRESSNTHRNVIFYLKLYYNRIRQLNNDSTVSNRQPTHCKAVNN